MARIRAIKPEFFTDEDVGNLAPLDRLFFIGMWCHADKAGRLKDKPNQLKVQILPYDRYNVGEGLARLVELGFLLRYTVSGESYLQVRTWDRHQKPHHTERETTYPALSNGDTAVKEPLSNGYLTPGVGVGVGVGVGGVEPVPDSTPDVPSKFTFPVKGTGEKEWNLPASKLAEFKAAYPGIDVAYQVNRALQWCRNNPAKQKTPGGMTRFLNRWLDDEQNKSKGNGPSEKKNEIIYSKPLSPRPTPPTRAVRP